MANRRAQGQGRERATEVVDRAARRAEARKRGKAGAAPDAAKGWHLSPRVWTGLALGVMILVFTRYYYWTIHPNPARPVSGFGEYALLTDAFSHGQASLRVLPPPQLLALKDPYDPQANARYRLHDASLYKGRYYIYFGAAPVLTVYLPYLLVTGDFLPDRVGTWVFAAAAYAMGCLLLQLLLRRCWPRSPRWLLFFLCACLGFSNVFPYVLRRPAVYETAIAAGQFFVLLALYAIARSALGFRRPVLMAAIAGVALAGALGSRPPMALAAVALGWFFLPNAAIALRDRRRRLAAALLPFTAGIVLQLAYNYARFDTPFEFGNHYVLAGINLPKYQFFSLSRLPRNLWFNILEPPRLRSRFPFVVIAPRPPFHIPKGFVGPERVAGIVWLAPLVLLLGAAPAVWRRIDSACKIEWAALAGTLAFLGAAWIGVDAMLSSTMRYEADFAGVLFIAAGLVLAGWEQLLASGARTWLCRGIVALGLFGVVVNAGSGITGYYDTFRAEAPQQYQALADWFSPLEQLLEWMGVPPDVAPAPGVDIS